nr:MAG TPA: hypothetical protein [Caudoviricetes sp.]DAR21807.1 MAG TPA: hypothetical protein [Caudoviricetes sp.]
MKDFHERKKPLSICESSRGIFRDFYFLNSETVKHVIGFD